jgi:hypothetical protein
MSDYSKPNASAPKRQNPERCFAQADQNHHPEALVHKSRAECRGRKENHGNFLVSFYSFSSPNNRYPTRVETFRKLASYRQRAIEVMALLFDG